MVSKNNDLIKNDLELLDFESDLLGTPLPSSEEKMDPSDVEYKINAKIKTREELLDSDTLLSVRNLKQFFFFKKGAKKTKLKAVNNVSFDIKQGECLGLVGESGCGKTTTGRSIIKLYDITSGAIYYRGYRISAGTRWNEKEIKFTKLRLKEFIASRNAQLSEDIAKLVPTDLDYKDSVIALKNKCASDILDQKNEASRICSEQESKIKQIKFDNKNVNRRLVNEIQMIFQDPIDSIDPRMTVGDIIAEGLIIQGFKNKEENHKKVIEILEIVGLVAEHASRYPHEFSGGQRQRIGIARALIMNPKLLICDEPISALDVSIRAQVINLLNDMKEKYGLTMLFVAHDLSVVKYFCDRIAVMYYGKIVEITSSEELFKNPLHPYTRSLLSAIPKPDPISEKSRTRITYNATTAHDYSVEKPDLREIVPGHSVYCSLSEFEVYKKMVEENEKKAAKVVEKPKTTDDSNVVETTESKEEVVKETKPTTPKTSSPKTTSSSKPKTTTVKKTTTTKKVVKKTTE